MSADELPQPPSSSEVRRRRTPPMWLWSVFVLIGVLVAYVRGSDLLEDHGYANIATLILGFVGIVALAVWFFFLSGFSAFSRLLTFAVCVACLSALAILFRLDHINGELLPVFAYRFSAKPDRLLPLPPADVMNGETANVNLDLTTKDDFPGFLGPQRSDSVDDVKLAHSWTIRPPELIWKQKIGAGWSAFSVVNGHAVTMEQRGDMEMTTCYDVETGRLEWAHATPERYEGVQGGVGPRSTPTIDDGKVYAFGAKGHLACLDGATGKPVWEKDLLQEYDISSEDEAAGVPWGRAASPLIVNRELIVPIGGGKVGRLISLAAFDKRSGVLLWEGGQRQISYSSPALATLARAEQILIVNEDTVSGHDVKTGRVLWEHPWPGKTNLTPNVSQAVPILPDQALLSKGYGGGAALLRLAPATGGTFNAEVVWKNPHVLKTKFTNVAIKDGYAYGLSDGILECVDLANGVSKWKEGRYGHGQILRAGDRLLVLTEKGEIVLVEATPDRVNKVLGRVKALAGTTWNNLALYDPYLLVRNAEEAACYKLPPAEQP